MRRAVAYRLRPKSPKFLHAPRGGLLYRSFFGAITGLALVTGTWSVTGMVATAGPAAAVADSVLQAPALTLHGRVARVQASLEPKPAPSPARTTAPDTAALQHTVPPPAPAPTPTPAQTSPSPSPAPSPTTQTPPPPPPASGGWPDGALGACIVMAESGGNPQAWNGDHWGLYQYDPGTWAAYGGNPADWGQSGTGAGEQEQIFMNTVAAGNQAIFDAWQSDGCPQKFGIY